MQADIDSGVKAVGKIPSGLFIVTTGKGTEGTGYLASWVQQVSFEPMVLAVGVNPKRPARDLFEESGHFVVNILGPENNDLMKHFARGFAADEPAFEGIELEESVSGAPILKTALASIECEVSGEPSQPGDHMIFYGKVIHGSLRATDKPKVHIRKSGKDY